MKSEKIKAGFTFLAEQLGKLIERVEALEA